MSRACCLALAAVVGIHATASADEATPNNGPLEVKVADGLSLRDPARGIDLAYKVSYPKGDGQDPRHSAATAVERPAFADTG